MLFTQSLSEKGTNAFLEASRKCLVFVFVLYVCFVFCLFGFCLFVFWVRGSDLANVFLRTFLSAENEVKPMGL